ncbi:Uncharacterised protein [Mycobacteroides abscessus subsp. abscessus]|nr:Uncharacterised protein [Mycobacteroides abscessus subsp. abscessus]
MQVSPPRYAAFSSFSAESAMELEPEPPFSGTPHWVETIPAMVHPPPSYCR